MMKIGDRVSAEIEGTIIDVSKVHGECYLIELDQRGFKNPRKVWVEAEDIPFLCILRKGNTVHFTSAQDLKNEDIQKMIDFLENLRVG